MKKAILILLMLGFIKTYSQDRSNTINIGFIDSLQSKVLNETRKFWVHIPKKFNENSSKKNILYYIYLMDRIILFQLPD